MLLLFLRDVNIKDPFLWKRGSEFDTHLVSNTEQTVPCTVKVKHLREMLKHIFNCRGIRNIATCTVVAMLHYVYIVQYQIFSSDLPPNGGIVEPAGTSWQTSKRSLFTCVCSWLFLTSIHLSYFIFGSCALWSGITFGREWFLHYG